MKKVPALTAVIEKEGKWYVATCPELGVASQGRTVKEAHGMVQEAASLFLGTAGPAEVKRCPAKGAKVRPLEMAHAWVGRLLDPQRLPDTASTRF